MLAKGKDLKLFRKKFGTNYDYSCRCNFKCGRNAIEKYSLFITKDEFHFVRSGSLFSIESIRTYDKYILSIKDIKVTLLRTELHILNAEDKTNIVLEFLETSDLNKVKEILDDADLKKVAGKREPLRGITSPMPEPYIKINEPTLSMEKKPRKSRDKVKHDYLKSRKLFTSFVVLDFETTGFDPVKDEIIQFGLVEYKDGEIIKQKSQYIKPSSIIPDKITRITGITDDMVADAPSIEHVINDLHDSLKGKTIVAHNADFDMQFLLQKFKNAKIKHERFRVVDTLTFSRKHINNVANHKLVTLKKAFQLDEGKSHDALNDCKATGKLAMMLYDKEYNI